MKELARLITTLDQSNKTNDKVSALQSYFQVAKDQDKIWTLALFTHRKPKRTVNTALLKEWITEWTGIPEWLFQESYHVVGDLAETIALLLTSNEGDMKEIDNPLSYYIETLIDLRVKSLEEKKGTTPFNL